jgi:N-methylhydantoinase B
MAHGALDGNGAGIGKDGVNSGGSYMSCPNVEWMELHYPLLYLFRRHAKDSAGAGAFRGGVGVESAHILHDAPQGKLRGVAYGVAGLRNSGHGIFGGYPGAPSLMTLLENTNVQKIIETNRSPVNVSEFGGSSRLLPYCNFELGRQDVLYMRVASGGGYGDPLERDPDLVHKDVANGLVSKDAAGAVYGVVLGNDAASVDFAATRELRKALRERELKGSE